MFLSSSMSSTASLVPSESKQRQSPQKDWTSAFATLSSQYGFGGKAPSVPPKQRNTSSAPSQSKTCDALQPVRETQSPKNYELVFGQLSSSYGFGGAMMSQPKRQ